MLFLIVIYLSRLIGFHVVIKTLLARLFHCPISVNHHSTVVSVERYGADGALIFCVVISK